MKDQKIKVKLTKEFKAEIKRYTKKMERLQKLHKEIVDFEFHPDAIIS